MQQRLVESLNEREPEVLALVTDGLSNRQVASKLFIGVGKVKTHVHNILGKLGVESAYLTAGLARSMLCKMPAVLHGR